MFCPSTFGIEFVLKHSTELNPVGTHYMGFKNMSANSKFETESKLKQG